MFQHRDGGPQFATPRYSVDDMIWFECNCSDRNCHFNNSLRIASLPGGDCQVQILLLYCESAGERMSVKTIMEEPVKIETNSIEVLFCFVLISPFPLHNGKQFIFIPSLRAIKSDFFC